MPKDVKDALPDVGIHRIRIGQRARLNGRGAGDILEEILDSVKEPRTGERVR